MVESQLDIICQKIHLCKNPTCTLYKTGTKNMYFLNKAKIEQKNRGIARPPLKILSASEFKENVQAIASYFQKFSNLSAQPLPKVDEDQDMFSTEFGSRGTAWRGRGFFDSSFFFLTKQIFAQIMFPKIVHPIIQRSTQEERMSLVSPQEKISTVTVCSFNLSFCYVSFFLGFSKTGAALV